MEHTPIQDAVDGCMLAEWHVARVFYMLFPSLFRYHGKRKWSYWDEGTGGWTDDVSALRQLQQHIKVDFCRKVLERATFWQQYMIANESGDAHAISKTIQRLLEITQKVQKEPFMRKIIRELHGFYEFPGDDST